MYDPFMHYCRRYLMALEATWQSNPPEKLLKERFRISTGFHPGQRDIIEQLVHGKRLLVIQRTGCGKSLCYQMAGLYYPYLTLVFSPLKALMRDQCQRCVDFSAQNIIRDQKQDALSNMHNYAELKDCYMVYLTTYLGDQDDYHCRTCGQCQASNFPQIRPSLRMYQAVMHFLDEGFSPSIEKRSMHQAGWSLSYHSKTSIGQ